MSVTVPLLRSGLLEWNIYFRVAIFTAATIPSICCCTSHSGEFARTTIGDVSADKVLLIAHIRVGRQQQIKARAFGQLKQFSV